MKTETKYEYDPETEYKYEYDPEYDPDWVFKNLILILNENPITNKKPNWIWIKSWLSI